MVVRGLMQVSTFFLQSDQSSGLCEVKSSGRYPSAGEFRINKIFVISLLSGGSQLMSMDISKSGDCIGIH